ncbi:MFS transporter [Schaalia hyovaginalis]|uniref:EmrB/QacA subfamily drug resistance transporter n=1 Tax=Schaalia hyovaginalis TaxID=29316 RepID=A0A923IZX3_9ACTO|nr:MFS transporter [Schaalia hyovaginalis]MBB6335224.1 EmrB/QacA subfamily drug resistance transporter [Schaalia hyovaginalis]MDY2667933.1 MFS transporter [Schaalia hyovaginalis]
MSSPTSTPDPNRWRILAVTMSVAFMALLDTTIVNIALPAMQDGLAASAGTIQWVVSGYGLTFGLVLVTGGRLGDAHGRRPLMLVGVTAFILTSIACGLAPSAGALIVARLFQGVSGGLILPQNAGIIQTFFTGAERARAFGAMGFTIGVSSAIGPVLGGLIIAALGEDAGWRAIFLVNVPIGIALLVAIARIIPAGGGSGDGHDLDIGGALLLGLAVASFIFPIATLEDGVSTALWLLVLVPFLAIATDRYERWISARGRTPILDIDLLQRTPGYVTGLLLGALYFIGFGGLLLVYSLYLQQGLGFSALSAGAILVAFAGANAIAAPIGGRLVPRFGRLTTVAALSLMILGMIATAVLVPPLAGRARVAVLLVTLFLTGLGAGAVVSPNLALSLAKVPTRMAGAAGAALQTGQRMGGALGAAVMMTVYEVGVQASEDPGTAFRLVIAASVVVIAAALGVALIDLRHDSPRHGGSGAGSRL